MRRFQVIGSVLFLWLVTAAIAFAEPDDCTQQGWAFGLFSVADNNVQYFAEGPLHAWTTGYIDNDGDYFELDATGFREHGIVVMSILYGDGRTDSVAMRMVSGELCGFVGDHEEGEDFVVLGNLRTLDSHTHRGVRPMGHGK